MSTREKVRLLVVEDSDTQHLNVSQMLSTSPLYNYIITEAKSLASAVKLIGVGKFDAVILDLSLPNGEGVETLIRFNRAMEILGIDIPVAVLTGSSKRDVEYESLKEQVTEFSFKEDIGKAEDLHGLLRRAVSRHAGKREAKPVAASVAQSQSKLGETLKEMTQQPVDIPSHRRDSDKAVDDDTKLEPK